VSDAERRRRRPLVLCYHAVDSSWMSPLALPTEVFVGHLSALERRGYVGLTFADAERRRREGTLPRRSVAVTFDDGYASTWKVKPILDQLGWPATVFVLTRFVGAAEPMRFRGSDPWSDSTPEKMASLDWDLLERLAESGWEVGSHTVMHPVLPRLDDEHLAHELTFSRQAIRERLGCCETIAYPYGVADARVASAARAAGYFAGCTLTPAHRVDEPYRRPRVGLAAHDQGWRRWAKLSPTVAALRRTRLAAALEPWHFRGRVPPEASPSER
jgi:peptidoglycan/xylan/chitin deacetylase (PgdA/CDA1 family)